MRLILTIEGGEQDGRQVGLPPGRKMSVGSTTDSSYCVTGYPDLSPRHFEIMNEVSGCVLRSLDAEKGVLVSGVRTGAGPLRDGDRIEAGGAVFVVEIEGAAKPKDEAGDPSGLAPVPAMVKGAPKDERLASDIKPDPDLTLEAKTALQPEHRPLEFVEELGRQKLYKDAVKFLAFCFEKPQAIHWAFHCLKEFDKQIPDSEGPAMKTVEDWLNSPTEESRALAAKAAEDGKMAGAGCWLASAVGWTGGSLAPPDQDPVPPPPDLTAQTCICALGVVATEDGDKTAAKRYQRFMERGKALLPKMPPAKP